MFQLWLYITFIRIIIWYHNITRLLLVCAYLYVPLTVSTVVKARCFCSGAQLCHICKIAAGGLQHPRSSSGLDPLSGEAPLRECHSHAWVASVVVPRLVSQSIMCMGGTKRRARVGQFLYLQVLTKFHLQRSKSVQTIRAICGHAYRNSQLYAHVVSRAAGRTRNGRLP